MFVGSVPLPAVGQLIRSVDCSTWPEIFVCCSGSFRIDRALKQHYPDKVIRSNDVSALSSALGALLTGTEIPLKFVGRLAFMEEAGLPDFESRAAALTLALAISGYAGSNDYATSHFEHVRLNFPARLAKAREKMVQLKAGVHVDEYFAGDFRDHAARAMQTGAGIVGFLPTYKNGYERLYRFIDENVEWPRPQFRTWDPKDLPAWLRSVQESSSPHIILGDQLIEGMTPTTEFRTTTNKPIYGYIGGGRSSFRRSLDRAESFHYEKVDAAALGPLTDVQLVPATGPQMTFLRNVYLAKGIAHSQGVSNFLVLLDGKLAGGFIFDRDKFDHRNAIYLLSDFCITHERRLAKLIAMLATSKEAHDRWCKQFVVRPKRVRTTAFTDKPVSMKYRTIYELTSRKEGRLEYQRDFAGRTAKDLYIEWLGRFGKAADEDRLAQAA